MHSPPSVTDTLVALMTRLAKQSPARFREFMAEVAKIPTK